MTACSHPTTTGIGACACIFVGQEQDLVANVGDRVFFDFDRSSLTDPAAATLHRQALWLLKYRNVAVLVAGNADERGTETYNLALAQQRADSVRDQLEAQGVAGTRIRTMSYGKTRPIAIGHDRAAYAQDRNAITSVDGHNPQD